MLQLECDKLFQKALEARLIKLGGQALGNELKSSEKVLIIQSKYVKDFEQSCRRFKKIIVIGEIRYMYIFSELRVDKVCWITPQELVEELIKIFKKDKIFSKKVSVFLTKERIVRQSYILRKELLTPLTCTEVMLLKELMMGKKVKELSASLFRSESTIHTHYKNIRKKLKLKGRHALPSFASANKPGIKTLLWLENNNEHLIDRSNKKIPNTEY